jgi:hypothetical protein
MKPGYGLILFVAFSGVALSPALDAADFRFHWNASSDPSVAAYGIYQRSGDAPYERIDEVPAEDLDDPARPSYLVTGLGDGKTYWFAATAISASNAESDFSNQTCITVNGQVVECTDNDEDGATVYISCFISAADGRISQKPAGR